MMAELQHCNLDGKQQLLKLALALRDNLLGLWWSHRSTSTSNKKHLVTFSTDKGSYSRCILNMIMYLSNGSYSQLMLDRKTGLID